jgi:hypothetical protein
MNPTLNAVRLGILLLGLATHAAGAQAGGAAATADSGVPGSDSAGQEGKKKGGGLFGKAKKLAGNKAVQQVAKTMACTMVPGGQVVAGAIDAAASDDVGEAAAGAAGAAAGQTCMPGGIGAVPQPTGGVAGAAGQGATAGAAGLAGMAIGGMPGGEMAGMAGLGLAGGGGTATAAMPGALGIDEMAACLGLTPEELLFLSDPTGGEAREPTQEEMDRQTTLTKKMDTAGSQSCLMQQRAVGMAPSGAGMALVGEPGLEAAPADGKLSEAAGKRVGLPKKLGGDLKKGRAVVRDIDWLTGGGEVAEAGMAEFRKAMTTLAAAMVQTGGRYRADIYLDKRYENAAATAIGSARLSTVVKALEQGGIGAGVVTAGEVKKDKRPRLEIVRATE